MRDTEEGLAGGSDGTEGGGDQKFQGNTGFKDQK